MNPANEDDTTTGSAAASSQSKSLIDRMRIALGPALPGIVLDLVDALSLTRLAGPFVSFPAGLAVGVWLSSYYSIAFHWRCLITLCSGLYTLTPGTEAIPLATILTCLGRFVESGETADKSTSPTQPTTNRGADSDRSQSTSAPNSDPVAAEDIRTRRFNRSSACCPECDSTSLRYGKVGQRFYSQESSVWSKGHEIQAFVCLDCGFVGHYLASDDLGQLNPPTE